jgi:hypothetical protein
MLSYLRERILDRSGPDPGPSDRRLYVSDGRPGPGVCYLSLAWSVGHEYRYYLAKPVSTDFEVDVRGLARTLDEMLSGKR